MSTPLLTPDDTQANRRIWAQWLRRPDWRTIPNRSGSRQRAPTPWNVGYELAYAHWPLSHAVIEEFSDSIEIEDEIMLGCYGLNENGLFDAAELPDAIRRTILLAAQAARSAPPYTNREAEDARNVMEDFAINSTWSVFTLSHTLLDIWEYDPSLMRGAILDPDDTARLIADILDAAPPTLLDPAFTEF